MKCPVCNVDMTVKTRHSVSVDICEKHGLWLDKGELSKITNNIVLRAENDKNSAMRKARKEGKIEGAWYGWLSLLLK